jgi:hypothetical protein
MSSGWACINEWAASTTAFALMATGESDSLSPDDAPGAKRVTKTNNTKRLTAMVLIFTKDLSFAGLK